MPFFHELFQDPSHMHGFKLFLYQIKFIFNSVFNSFEEPLYSPQGDSVHHLVLLILFFFPENYSLAAGLHISLLAVQLLLVTTVSLSDCLSCPSRTGCPRISRAENLAL